MLGALKAMRDWNGNDLTKIACPALVLWGDGDRTYKWPQIEKLWQSIPISNLAVVPFCAHAVHMEQPDVFNSLVMNFFGQRRQ
jgi:pimeloyl-ACP methyl ester carboxylesterase